MDREARTLAAAAVILVLTLPAVSAQSTSVTIDYGRSWPLSLAVDSARGVVYADGESGIYPPTGFSFGIINSTSEALLAVLPLPGEPGKLALDESSGTVYVASDKEVITFDWRTRSFEKPLSVGLPIQDLVYDNYSNKLLFTSGGSIYQLDPPTGAIARSARVGDSAQGIAVDWTKGEVYVADYLSASVAVFRSSDLSLVKTVSLPSPAFPWRMVFGKATNAIFVTTDEGTIDVIDTNSKSFVRSIDVGLEGIKTTWVVSLYDRGGLLFVASNPGDSIAEVDASTGAVVATYPVTSTVYDMAVDQTRGELYATSYHQVIAISPAQEPSSTPVFIAAAAIGLALAVALVVVLYSRRVSAIGGTRGGSSSQPQTPQSSSSSFHHRPRAAPRLTLCHP